MFILRGLLRPLQTPFSDTTLGQERDSLFAYTLLSIIAPFTSSITAHCLRCLETLFGIEIKQKRFYTFMASSTLPWQKLWRTTWRLIANPETDGRVLVAVDDSINPKAGKNIFGCDTIFDHAAKANQSQYPWSQNLVAVGLLKQIKGRWACLFLVPFGYWISASTWLKKPLPPSRRTHKSKAGACRFKPSRNRPARCRSASASFIRRHRCWPSWTVGLGTTVCTSRCAWH